MDTWRTDYLDTTGYFYSGSHYVTFCENFISTMAPFVGKQRGFVPCSLARKVGELYLDAVAALTSEYWSGVRLERLEWVSPDSGGWMRFLGPSESSVGDAMELLLNFSPHNWSLNFCLFGGLGTVEKLGEKKLDQSRSKGLLKEAVRFKKNARFDPDLELLILGRHLEKIDAEDFEFD
mmetsp:Transcript_65469/g.112567  ORF Transcript_65469/g.112567 Transcript_65469/m.112567 type:complete len:178 (-) Transcript_65469:39-572(-)